jgi:hypothetical protein
MADDLASAAVTNARDAAHRARQLSDQHQRAHRDPGPASGPVAQRGEELKRLATEASARYEVIKQQARGAASVKRRLQTVAADAELQGRLRGEAQARREAAAAKSQPPRRGHR